MTILHNTVDCPDAHNLNTTLTPKSRDCNSRMSGVSSSGKREISWNQHKKETQKIRRSKNCKKSTFFNVFIIHKSKFCKNESLLRFGLFKLCNLHILSTINIASSVNPLGGIKVLPPKALIGQPLAVWARGFQMYRTFWPERDESSAGEDQRYTPKNGNQL